MIYQNLNKRISHFAYREITYIIESQQKLINSSNINTPNNNNKKQLIKQKFEKINRHLSIPSMMNTTPTSQSQQQQTPYGNLNYQIRENRMYALMKDELINFICNIFITFNDEELDNHQEIALRIKMHMDKLYGPPWHCIVGKGFGSAVTYNNKNFIYLYISNKAIMVYRH